MLSTPLLYGILMLTSSVGSVSGNILLLIISVLNPKLHTDTSPLSFNLNICDLILGLTVIPAGIYNSLSGVATFTEHQAVCQLTAFLYVLLQLASINSLTWITVDKFAEICYPLHYAQLITKQRIWLILVFLWIYCILNATAPLFGFGTYSYNESKYICLPSFSLTTKAYSVIFLSMGIVVPVLATCFMYSCIIHTARHQAKRGTFVCNDQHCYYVPAKSYFRSTILLISTTICLLICWTPYITISFYETFQSNAVPPLANAISIWLVLFTSALDPWVNAMVQKKYRQALCESWKKLKQKFVCKTQEIPAFPEQKDATYRSPRPSPRSIPLRNILT
ncbi:histamine H2 receptor-like [Protopterus annectens]|uniref:histamine H2 receptor-like n=1 Tax=Protopterus annectens TaxID=7888 RepID=UPI001CF9DDEB|nr:histamine H2 receptor-like [Protopterus annectens]